MRLSITSREDSREEEAVGVGIATEYNTQDESNAVKNRKSLGSKLRTTGRSCTDERWALTTVVVKE